MIIDPNDPNVIRYKLYEAISIPLLSIDDEKELRMYVHSHFSEKGVVVFFSYERDNIIVEFRGDKSNNLTDEDIAEFKLRWL